MKRALVFACVFGFFAFHLYQFSQDEFLENGWRFATFMGSAIFGLVAFFAAVMAFVLFVTVPMYRAMCRDVVTVIIDLWNRFLFGCLVFASVAPLDPWFWIKHVFGIVFLGGIFLWSGYWFLLSVLHGAFLFTSIENTVGFLVSGFVACMSFSGLKFSCQMAKSRALLDWESGESCDSSESS